MKVPFHRILFWKEMVRTCSHVPNYEVYRTTPEGGQLIAQLKEITGAVVDRQVLDGACSLLWLVAEQIYNGNRIYVGPNKREAEELDLKDFLEAVRRDKDNTG